jgi:hypothetical protein
MSDLIINNETIKNGIKVHTNLDVRVGYWVFPEVFRTIPEVGDYIDNNQNRFVKVCNRTFNMDGSITIEVTGVPLQY